MYLKKNTYAWSLDLGRHEVSIVSRALTIAADSGELTGEESDMAAKMNGLMEKVMEDVAHKEREYREQRERNDDGDGNRRDRGDRSRFAYKRDD